MSNPIKISLFGNGKNDNNFTHYVFEMIIFFKNREPIVIEETTIDKYINLFSYNYKINFNDIKFYQLNINIMSFNVSKYSIKNKFVTSNENTDYHTFQDDVIYLEINKNIDNYANCCIYINNDKSRLFFTPPNY
jgi:hypothetical protein